MNTLSDDMRHRVHQRLARKLNVLPSDCWIWTGGVYAIHRGYAMCTIQGHTSGVHRWAYLLFTGDIPKGYQIDHLCKNKLCCNPAHLEAVTPRENLLRSGCWEVNRSKTHCPRGHSLSGDNLMLKKNGWRDCRACCYLNRWLKKNPGRTEADYSPGNYHLKLTHCPQGHPYDAENTYLYRGHRMCKICQSLRQKSQANTARSHCRKGHPLNAETSFFDTRGRRCCKACAEARWDANRKSR